MRVFFTIIRAIVVSAVVFVAGYMNDLTMETILIFGGAIVLTLILLDILLRVRRYDAIMHVDDSHQTMIMQLEFCADPRRLSDGSEMYVRIDRHTPLTPKAGRKTDNELVQKALDEIEELH